MPVGHRWDHPPAPALLATLRLPPATLDHGTFRSASMGGTTVGYNVLLPPHYADTASIGARYPVVYYLHGRGDDECYQLADGDFLEKLHAAMASGMLPPMIYVMAFGGRCARCASPPRRGRSGLSFLAAAA